MNYKRLYIASTLILVLSAGCSSLVEVDMPTNQLTDDEVFADSASAIGALSRIYFVLGNNLNNNFNKQVSLYVDEYTLTSSSNTDFYRSMLTALDGTNANIWSHLYQIVYACNDILEQVPASSRLSENVKAQLISEAKFLRAYAYFYLQNTYGYIPLLLQTDVNINRIAAQVDDSAVFAQIQQDLEEAKAGLSIDYPSTNKVRVNRWASAALLARVQLYQGNWPAAEAEATAVINSAVYGPIDDMDQVFQANSREAIFQIWTPNGFISDATQLIPANNTTPPLYTVTDALYESFEMGDRRKDYWTANSTIENNEGASTIYHRPFKYRNRAANTSDPEYLMVLRLAEQYLIRAEARMRQGNLSDAINDLNVIRKRADLPTLRADISPEECFEAIFKERRVELFGEWGHRFFDLKRTGQLDAVMKAYKDTWRSNAAVFPIPQNELVYNPNLIQNDGF
jgi:SusD family.